jgi:hypothetical protein
VKEFLPKFILGYSSGHNEILSLPFFKMRFIHFDEYRNRLVGDLDYGGKPEGGMIYVDDQFSQAILLCHYLFPSEAVTVAATIVIKVKLRTKDVLHLQPDEIDLTFSSPTHEEEVESWKDVFGIEERYKAKLCSESDGKAWLQRITEESTDSNLSKDQALEYELRAAKRVIEHDAGFLKIPFLIACRDAKIV